MRPHFCNAKAVVLVEQRQKLHCNNEPIPPWVSGTLNIKKETILDIVLLGCWGEVSCMYPLQMRPNPYVISGVTRAHVGQSLPKIYITNLYMYFIFFESLC